MAVTASYDANYVYVDISLSTDTFDDVYTNIGNAAVLSRSGSVGSYVYTILGNRAFYVRGSTAYCTLQAGCTLALALTGNKSPALRNISGTATSVFKMEEGTTLDLSSLNPALTATLLCYSSMVFAGTQAAPITIKNWYNNTFYSNKDCYAYMDWVNIIEPCTLNQTGGNALAWGWDCSVNAVDMHFKHININGFSNGLPRHNGMVLSAEFCSHVIFEDIVIENCYYGLIGYADPVKMLRCTFRDCLQSTPLARGGTSFIQMYNRDANRLMTVGIRSQPKFTFEECVFDNNYKATGANNSAYRYSYNTTVKFKNCTFQNARYGIEGAYAAVFMSEGTQTFNSCTTNIAFNSYFALNDVYPLDLTILDSAGGPLEGATVTVRQKEDKELWHFRSDSNGKVLDLFGDPPVFSYRHQYSAGTYETWSDGVGDRIHVIEAFKAGEGYFTIEVAFDQDRVIVAQLTEFPTRTVLNNVVLNNAVIY